MTREFLELVESLGCDAVSLFFRSLFATVYQNVLFNIENMR